MGFRSTLKWDDLLAHKIDDMVNYMPREHACVSKEQEKQTKRRTHSLRRNVFQVLADTTDLYDII